MLIGDDGKPIPCHEPIPGVYLAASVYDTPGKVRDKLRELFPPPFFADLRAKHAAAFEADPDADDRPLGPDHPAYRRGGDGITYTEGV
jgi:hypothetical protein